MFRNDLLMLLMSRLRKQEGIEDIPSPIFNYSNVNDSVVQQNLNYTVNVNKESNQTNPIIAIIAAVIVLPWIIYFIADSGNLDETDTGLVTDLEEEPTFSSISVGSDHTCVVEDYPVYCWGLNKYGQVGKGFADDLGILPLISIQVW